MDRIVAGVDGSDASKDALRWAIEESRIHGAEVVAVYAWTPPVVVPEVSQASLPSISLEVAALQASALELVTNIVRQVAGDKPSVTGQPVAAEGYPASVLVEATREADLLVVGSRGHGGFAGLLLGSVSQRCVQDALCARGRPPAPRIRVGAPSGASAAAETPRPRARGRAARARGRARHDSPVRAPASRP